VDAVVELPMTVLHPFLDTLTTEHRQIERVLAAVARAVREGAATLAGGRQLPFEIFPAAVAFFRTFADGAHHVKEEDGLFAAMIGAGASSERGPVACMLRGHDTGRDLVAQISAALAAREGGERGWELDLLESAALYHDFLLEHITREDRFIYPLAAATVPVTVFDELDWRYRAGGADPGAMVSAADRIEALAAASPSAAPDAGNGRGEPTP
jgi:hemerythrin-like domain-containing protein